MTTFDWGGAYMASTRNRVVQAAQSDDPIGGLLQPQQNSFRLAMKEALARRANIDFLPDLEGGGGNTELPPLGGLQPPDLTPDLTPPGPPVRPADPPRLPLNPGGVPNPRVPVEDEFGNLVPGWIDRGVGGSGSGGGPGAGTGPIIDMEGGAPFWSDGKGWDLYDPSEVPNTPKKFYDFLVANDNVFGKIGADIIRKFDSNPEELSWLGTLYSKLPGWLRKVLDNPLLQKMSNFVLPGLDFLLSTFEELWPAEDPNAQKPIPPDSPSTGFLGGDYKGGMGGGSGGSGGIGSGHVGGVYGRSTPTGETNVYDMPYTGPSPYLGNSYKGIGQGTPPKQPIIPITDDE